MNTTRRIILLTLVVISGIFVFQDYGDEIELMEWSKSITFLQYKMEKALVEALDPGTRATLLANLENPGTMDPNDPFVDSMVNIVTRYNKHSDEQGNRTLISLLLLVGITITAVIPRRKSKPVLK
jgi:hypothetical protein